LVKGKNSIIIIAESFSSKNGAGFNLVANIKSEGKQIVIKTDDSESASVKWVGRELNIHPWKEVVSKSYPFEVIAPNFKTKRTSWIER